MKSLLEKLETFLMPLCKEGAALAFSGGVDSTLLLAVLSRMQKKASFPLLVLNAVSTLQSVQDKEAVDKAALEYGIKVTGATVHYVNEIPDGGKIILQKSVNIKDGDTPEILQRRVMEKAEWIILPRACELVSRKLLKEKKC